jgi:hypothetical protein
MATGRPRKYATEAESKEAKRAKDRERVAAKRVLATQLETIDREDISQCCIDWHDSSPHRGWKCRQHQDYDKFAGQSAARYRVSQRHSGAPSADGSVIAELSNDASGVRVSANPDSWQPINQADKQQDKAETELVNGWIE